jgi:hypothetical protein
MNLRTTLLGALALVAALGGAARAQPFYTTLTGSEGIQDQLNATGASFTSGLVHATSQGINAQTGTSYTVIGTTGTPQSGAAPAGDMGKLVTFSNTGAIAVTLPAAGTAGFEANKWFCAENLNSGTVTITPTTSTINGAATLALGQNRGVCIWSDGTNYQIESGAGGLAGTVLTVPEGGTGDSTLTSGGFVIGAGTSALTATKSPTGMTSINGNAIPTNAGGTFLTTAGAVSATTGLTLTPLRVTDMRTATGVMMGTSASGTVFGLTVSPGTGAYLVGTATSSGSTSNVAYVEFVLPPNYIAGTNLTLGISCYYLNGSSTASVHTMTGAAYLENTTTGAQGSTLIASGAVTCPITTASNQTVTVTGTTLLPGSYLGITFSAAVTNGGGASTEYLTGATIQ